MALTKIGKEGITGISNASDATAITITSSELVGIGTTSPNYKLDVRGASLGGTSGNTVDMLKLYSNVSNGSHLNIQKVRTSTGSDWTSAGTRIQQRIDVTNQGYIQFNGDGNHSGISFGENSTERMRMDTSGNVLVGCTVPPSTSVNGAGFISGNGYELKLSNAGTTNTTRIRFFNANGEVGTIRTSGSATSYNTSSDYRLKENVDYDWDATTRLKQLKPARFNFIADADTTVDGFLAHEAQAIVPEAISGTKDAMTTEVLYVEGDELPDGKSIGDVKEASVPDYQGIDQSKLVPLLVKTIQELEARLTAGGL